MKKRKKGHHDETGKSTAANSMERVEQNIWLVSRTKVGIATSERGVF